MTAKRDETGLRFSGFFAFLSPGAAGLSAAVKSILILFAVVGGIVAARADLVVQQQISTMNNTNVTTMKIKGAKVRLDLYAGQPRAMSTIMDLNTGDSIVLLHTQKMYVKTLGRPAKQSKPSGSGHTVSAAPKPRPTGKTEKVGIYDTDIYTWSNSRGITGTAWVARNFPNFAKIQADLAVLDKSPASVNNDASPALSLLPGMMVKSRLTGGGQSITVTLISAREEPLDASLFGVPPNYREMPRPKPLKPLNQPPTKPPPKTAPAAK